MRFTTDDASVQEIIKLMLTHRKMSISDLANELGTSKQNLCNKFRRGNMCEKDIVAISEVLGYKVIICFEEMEVHNGQS